MSTLRCDSIAGQAGWRVSRLLCALEGAPQLGRNKAMNKKEMKFYKQRLLTLRAQLRADMYHMVGTAFPSSSSDGSGGRARSPIHPADVSGDCHERELAVGLMQFKDAALAHIEEALERIEAGVYGTCSDCQRGIPGARLKVIPYASRCVTCAAQFEAE